MTKYSPSALPLVIIALVGLAIGLRVAGITWGLPNTFNGDEPHIVNLAVSFGSGSLRPYAFKYPTLWPYLLFAGYGLYFLFWSAFGLKHGVADFIGLYAWEPTGFYLIGRGLSALLTLLGVFIVWKIERQIRTRTSWPWAALLLAFSPLLVDLAHSCKPDSLMFFLICAAWYWAVKVYRLGERRAYWACGFVLGLAISAQYTALAAASVLPLAHFMGSGRRSWRWLGEGVALIPAGLAGGSPFILLDFPRFWFWVSMHSPTELVSMGQWDRGEVFRSVMTNVWHFASPGPLAGLAALLGLGRLLIKDKNWALVVAGPVAVYVAILCQNPDGGWQRYLLGCFPALALLSAEGMAIFERPSRPLLNLFLATAVLTPGVVRSALQDRDMRLSDTRQEAEAWAQANIPQGATVLMDLPDVSPRLAMTKEEIEELWRKTKEAGSPRARLYRGMADSHPGGGYTIYRIVRGARDLGTYHPKQVAISQADSPMLDVHAGLAPARARGVGFVITSDFGASRRRSAELALFFEELHQEGKLLKVFAPSPGRRAGPLLRIYRLHES